MPKEQEYYEELNRMDLRLRKDEKKCRDERDFYDNLCKHGYYVTPDDRDCFFDDNSYWSENVFDYIIVDETPDWFSEKQAEVFEEDGAIIVNCVTYYSIYNSEVEFKTFTDYFSDRYFDLSFVCDENLHYKGVIVVFNTDSGKVVVNTAKRVIEYGIGSWDMTELSVNYFDYYFQELYNMKRSQNV